MLRIIDLPRALRVALFFAGCVAVSSPNLSRAQSAERDDVYVSPGGAVLRMLLDASNLDGREVEVAELTFQPGSESVAHVHRSVEVFYVLTGELEHIVNGTSYVLTPGMLGFVRAPDNVVHKVRPDVEPTKVLVIWAPGGEAGGLTNVWVRQQ